MKLPSKYPSEESFVLFKKKQDAASFQKIYQEWSHLVYGVSLKYLQNIEDAKDAVTDIFEKLWHEIPQQNVHFWKSWLYAVTKFHCLMQIRARKAKYQHLSQDPWEDLESNLEREPWWNAIEQAAEELKPEQKHCIQLFYWKGLSYEEIADQQGINMTTVKSHLQNGKRNMRIWIEQHHGKP